MVTSSRHTVCDPNPNQPLVCGQVELAHRMRPLEPKNDYEEQVRARTGGISRTLWDSNVSGLRERALPLVPDDPPHFPDRGYTEGGREMGRGGQVVGSRGNSLERATERREMIQGSFSRSDATAYQLTKPAIKLVSIEKIPFAILSPSPPLSLSVTTLGATNQARNRRAVCPPQERCLKTRGSLNRRRIRARESL